MKLVALGDSVIKGVVLHKENKGNRYSLVDKSIVEYCANKLGGESVNLGKMGCTIEVCERILDRHIDELTDSEYVLLECGGNDSDYDWLSIAKNPNLEHLPNTPLERFVCAYVRIINKVIQKGAKPIILSLPPMNADKYFEFVSEKWSNELRNNMLSWLGGTTNTIISGHELYNQATMLVAQRTGAQWIDVMTILQNDNQSYLCEDGIHPNELGQRRIADMILSVLR